MKPGESFIGQPIRALQTMLRVIAEREDKYLTVVPDGIYGPSTVSAVSRFQNLHGMSPTGVTDQNTWEQIVAEYDMALIEMDEAELLHVVLNPGQVIGRGEKHPHVRIVQAILAVLSEQYSSITPPTHSGILDNATIESISSFQELNLLPVTGRLDKRTWKHLALQYPLASTLLERG